MSGKRVAPRKTEVVQRSYVRLGVVLDGEETPRWSLAFGFPDFKQFLLARYSSLLQILSVCGMGFRYSVAF